MKQRHLVIRPLAATDITEAAIWYHEQRDGLGDKFLKEVRACLTGVLLSPESFRKVHREHRRAFVQRFPYFVVFHLSEEEVIVTSLMHAKRRPATWKRRH